MSVIDGNPCGTESEGYLVPARQSVTIPGWRLNNDAVAKFVFNDKSRSYTAQMGHGQQNAGVIGFMVFEEEHVAYHILPPPRPIPRPYPWPPVQPYWAATSRGTAGGPVNDPTYNMAETITGSDDDTNVDISSKGVASVDILSSGVCSNTASVGSSAVDRRITLKSEEAFSLGTGWGSEQAHHVDIVDFTRNDVVNPTEMLSIYYDTRKGLENRGIKVVQTKKKKVTDLPNAFPTYSEKGATPPPGWKGKKRR